MTQEIRYSDLDLDFIRHPVSNDISLKIDSNAVKRSLRNLILYRKYDKPFHPEINSGVQDLLFNPATFVTAMEIQKRIEDIIRLYEPRVVDVNVRVGLNVDTNNFDVFIRFTVRNSLARVETLSLNIERTR